MAWHGRTINRADQRIIAAALRDDLSKAEVGHADVALCVKQDVLGLEVCADARRGAMMRATREASVWLNSCRDIERTAVGDAERVQVRQREHDFGGVHARQRLLKNARPVQLEKEMAAVDEVEDQVQLRCRLWGMHRKKRRQLRRE